MNKLLSNYIIQVEYPDVSGAEHLEMLQTRDKLAGIKATLTEEECSLLFNADRQLIRNVVIVNEELSQFIDLKSYRVDRGIASQNWWWYLDVLSHLSISMGGIEGLPAALPVAS